MKLKDVKNISTLASYLAKQEKGKSKVRLCDVRELLSILSDAAFRDTQVLKYVYKNGKRRAKKK